METPIFADATPSVNYLNTLRNSGHNNYSAIADIIDNSLDTNVNSTMVKVNIKKHKDDYEHIMICDNGCGIDFETLLEIFKLGVNTGKIREFDLGSYGVGLKASALSMGKRFELQTCTSDGNFYIAIYDLDVMINDGNFLIPIRVGTPDEYDIFKTNTGSETGTIIIIKKLDKITNTNLSIFKDILIKRLGEYFKYFIDEFHIKIMVNETEVKSVDPMLRNEPYVRVLTNKETFYYNQHEIKFGVFYIEKCTESKDREIGRNQFNSGIYVYRNNRLVGSGLDLGIVKKQGDGYSNGCRIEMFVNGNIDDLVGSTNIKIITEKDKNEINQGFRETCIQAMYGYITTCRNLDRPNHKIEKVPEEVVNEIDDIMKDLNGNKMIDIKKKGKNENQDINIERPEVKNPGRNKFSPRERSNIFSDWRPVSLGVTGDFFRTMKENGLYILEINKDHPFFEKFLVNANHETKSIIIRLLISLSISLEKITYFDDTVKESIMNEYFTQVSENLRKFLIY